MAVNSVGPPEKKADTSPSFKIFQKVKWTVDEGKSLQPQKGFLDDFGVEEFLACSLVDGPSGL
jgi:hypothetical protein